MSERKSVGSSCKGIQRFENKTTINQASKQTNTQSSNQANKQT
jgi:hypothetical protein